jgi:predicted tellurium resistance membrane protein TerC
MVLMSNLVSMLMDRNPISIYCGAAILGKIDGEMTITDPAVASYPDPSKFLQYSVEVGSEIGIRIIMQS